ncbi:hypothetical protein GEMRC1_012801 [Eukaryota sp. GEM-RC1]
MFIGDFMFVVSTVEIKAGDELFISYVDPLLPFTERNKLLESFNCGRGFACQCERCCLTRHDKSLINDEQTSFDLLNMVLSQNSKTSLKKQYRFLSSINGCQLIFKMETSPNCLKVGYLNLLRAEAFSLKRKNLEEDAVLLLEKYVSAHKLIGLDGFLHLSSHPVLVLSDLLLHYILNLSKSYEKLMEILKRFKKIAWVNDHSDDFIIDSLSKHSGISAFILSMHLKR